MKILGVSGGVKQGNQDAAAVLLLDGQLAFAQEEERFTGSKHAVGSLPEKAIAAALAHTGLSMKDIDAIAFHTEYFDLEENLKRYFTHLFGHCPPIRFKNHHLAHAASTYYASGFDDSMIITADLSGDGISTTLCHGKGRDIKTLRVFNKPQSLGIFYSIVTQALGFRRDNDEYKVMGMCGYGEATEDLSWALKIEEGGYEFNEDCIVKVAPGRTNPSKQEPLYSDYFINKIGFCRNSKDPYDERHFNLAASAQESLNIAAESMTRWLSSSTGTKNMCVAGGVGLNCVMNQRMLAMDEVENIFVQPASSDAGCALGAAYLVAIDEGEALAPFPGAQLGNEFDDSAIKAELDVLGAPYRETNDPAGVAAEAIASGKIIGWFQGRHEFGPRALGGRSILADPGDPDMKDKINMRVKFREEFRPFAPSALEEDAGKYFETHGNPLPYMTVTCDVKPEHADEVRSIVHVDDTARAQTVNREMSPMYHDLISNFKKRTGKSAVLNTSYNVKGQTVVNNTTQAVGTLFGSGMDMAVIGPFVVEKKS